MPAPRATTITKQGRNLARSRGIRRTLQMVIRFLALCAAVFLGGIAPSSASIIYTIEQPGTGSVIPDESTWIRASFSSPNFISGDLTVPGSDVTATGDYATLGVSSLDFLSSCPDGVGLGGCDEVVVHYNGGGASFYYLQPGTFDTLGDHPTELSVSALDVTVPEPSVLAMLGVGVAGVLLYRRRRPAASSAPSCLPAV
ncbi:MAG: PEP-CTERM sorting domain-containing protein [Alphaproteobacteria bacterium]|nr:PEP-CTERM sorting domain-containing protein [Alphaproteobacteria bacterium]